MKVQEIFVEAENVSSTNVDFFVQHVNEKQAIRFKNTIEKINNALIADEITNPEFQDAKYVINITFELSFNNAFKEKYMYGGKWETLPKDVYEQLSYVFPGLHTIKSLEKKVAKIKSKHPAVDDIKKFINAANPIVTAMSYLKTKIVKKVRADVEKEEKEIKHREKLASHSDVKRIKELLTQITKNVYEDAIDANKKWLYLVANYVIKKVKENPKESKMTLFAKDPFGYHVASLVLDRGKPKNNYSNILDNEAKKMTDKMMNRFISKNTSKLSEIVVRKNNMKDVTLIDANTSKGTVEGTLKFNFKDKSEFIVHNKVVHSYSKYNTPFYRVPTTFHSVKMPDGSNMKQPSESKMIDVFAA